MPTKQASSEADVRPASRSPEQIGQDVMEIVRHLPDVLFRCVKGEDGRIYWTLNEGGLAEEFHLTTKQIRGKTLEELFPGGASQTIKDHFEAAFQGSTETFINEMGGRYFKHFPQPVHGPDGRVEAVVGYITDVTELVHAEQVMERANKDLEAFAYTISHDLRTPLTVLSTFAQVLEGQKDRLDENGRKAVDRIGAAALRMADMVADVLQFSRAGRGPVKRAPVDLAGTARRLADDLHLRHPGHAVDLHMPDRLEAEADPALAEVVLANLLGNAWKFTKDTPEPRIELGQAESRGRRAYYVRDNGTGFPADQAERLFEPFQRLEGTQAVEGTGIGLATVQRVVRSHGGDAWAEGEPGRGATFWFTFDGTEAT